MKSLRVNKEVQWKWGYFTVVNAIPWPGFILPRTLFSLCQLPGTDRLCQLILCYSWQSHSEPNSTHSHFSLHQVHNTHLTKLLIFFRLSTFKLLSRIMKVLAIFTILTILVCMVRNFILELSFPEFIFS